MKFKISKNNEIRFIVVPQEIDFTDQMVDVYIYKKPARNDEKTIVSKDEHWRNSFLL